MSVSPSDDIVLVCEEASDLEDYLREYADAAERIKVDKLALTQDMLQLRDDGGFALTIGLHMVCLVQVGGNTGDDEAPGDDYDVCVLESHDGGGQELYTFWFDSPMTSLPVKVNCKHLICFPAEDGKMSACVYGLSTCGLKFPCLRCLWELKIWSYPKCMKEDCRELFNDI
jgi:hypothetical protein